MEALMNALDDFMEAFKEREQKKNELLDDYIRQQQEDFKKMIDSNDDDYKIPLRHIELPKPIPPLKHFIRIRVKKSKK
jgi:hypothetical protein